MKKICLILSVAFLTLSLSSCVENSKKYKELQAENAKLTTQNQTIEAEYNQAVATINEVENTLKSIQETEGMMSVNPENGNSKELVDNMVQVKQQLEQSRAKIAELEEKLAKSKRDNGALAATVRRLKEEIARKEEAILALQAQVEQLNGQVTNLNTQVTGLKDELAEANRVNEENLATIAGQTNEINTVYYVFGTKKELKQKGILAKRAVLRNEVSTTVFQTADKRELKSLPLNAKKAVVLSSNPIGSYEIVTGEDGKKVLNILDSNKFWNITDYLVILTK